MVQQERSSLQNHTLRSFFFFALKPASPTIAAVTQTNCERAISAFGIKVIQKTQNLINCALQKATPYQLKLIQL